MASFSSQAVLSDLQDRINVAKQELDTLRETDEEYEVKKMVLEHGLASLETQFENEQEEAYRRRHEDNGNSPGNSPDLPIVGNYGHHRPQSSDATMKPVSMGFAPYAGSSNNAFGGHFASDGVMAGQGRPATALSWGFGSLEDAVTPDTTTFPSMNGRLSSGSISSPDSGFLRPQKRQRESLGLSNSGGHAAKSLRTTPSPAITGTTTPTSLESFEFPDDPDLFHLLGGNPKDHIREMREEQKAQEKLLEARRKQEREDEEFARSLQQYGEGDGDIGYGEHAIAGPSTAPRSASQTVLDSQGRYRRPEPLSSPFFVGEDPFSSYTLPVKQESMYRRDHSGIKQENTNRNTNGHVPVKQERSHQPQSFIDLGSDDEFGATGESSHPSSDLVEIDPSTFANNRSIPGPYNPYGNTAETSGPSTWGNTGGQIGQSIVNATRGVYNSAYNLVDQQLAEYGTIPSGFGGIGGSSVYDHGAGSSSTFIDLDSDDQPQDLTSSVFGRHGINPNDPANRELVESYMDRINYVTHDPTRTTAEIKSLLENIRPDEELPPENREGTPEAMTYALMEHQKLGLTWMRTMEEGSNKGGILADDMGLGKTIQALALMVARRSTDRKCKTTLIVAPVALLKQWERTLASELKRREDVLMKKRANPNWRPTGREDSLPLLGDECKWYRVILDEAQWIKNKSTKQAQAVSQLQALTRFCMTGTPMMNNVSELYSLIHFLRIRPYCEPENFRRDFTTPLKSSSDSAKSRAMRKLQALLKAILLRRTKKSQIDGKSILDLPERTTEQSHAIFSDDELAFYKALETHTQLTFNKYLKANTVGRNYSNILVLLLRLRQACCHPHLIKDFGQASGSSDVTPEEMMKLARELAPEVVARIKEQCSLNEDSAMECPANAEGNEGRNLDIKCPNCRGKILPTKVIDHNAFKRVYLPELMADGLLDDEGDSQADVETTDNSDSDDDDDDDDDEEDDEVDSKGNLLNFVVRDDVDDDSSETEEGDESYSHGKAAGKKPSTSKKAKKRNKGKGKAKTKEKKPPRQTLAELKKAGMRNLKARQRYLKRLNKEWIPSGKTEKTMEILRAIQERKDPETNQCEKTIIFSQFTSLLDLLEVPVASAGWGYRRYDGSMSANARNDAVIDFTDRKECKIMLVSLKAGNAGLNLIAASQVIILDPFWNPFVEEQAIDRAHRIGQQKPVQVHRVLVPNTVEDRILALQEKKRELIEAALDEKASQNVGRLGIRELGFLFDVST
ncbi:MAG: hypothetical protein ASARMPRED_004625 [Alectoria sarmentosa]|nr:MAG: hypothetical protein ASARMPRED_004625 [Alectoria sarmentosa]